MSGIGGLLKSVMNPTTLLQLGMGPAGWASILAKSLISAVGQQVIQQLGQQMGLPDSMTKLAAEAFAQSSGFGSNFGRIPGFDAVGNFNPRALTNDLIGRGFSFTDANRISQDVVKELTQMKQDIIKDSVQDFIDKLNRNQANKRLEQDVESVMSGKGSVLMKIAVAMGKVADKKMNDMADKTDKLGKFGEVDGKNQGQYAQLTGEIQALGQEMSMISQAMSNVIKSVGESAAAIARK